MENIELIKGSILELEKMSGDDEAAHGFEDDLYKSVLRDIANGAPNATELAAEVLKAEKIKFERWCA